MLEEDFFDKLKADCPLTMQGLHGLETSPGWNHIIKNVVHAVENHVDDFPLELKNQIYFVQIKQKFGGLRIYMSHHTPFVDGVITLAEYLCYTICENCGVAGKKRNIGNYICVLCEEHYKEAIEKSQYK
jgi:hypothetical protein